MESRTSTFSWLWTTVALTKDPEGQDLTSQARAGLHAMANSSITSPSKNTIGCACVYTSQGVLGPKEDFKSYHSMLLMHVLSSTCRAGGKFDNTSGKIVSLLKSPKQLGMSKYPAELSPATDLAGLVSVQGKWCHVFQRARG